MSRLRKGMFGGLTAAGLLAVGFVGGWEGMRTKAYPDIIGVPTVCFGETRGVKLGDEYTPDECRAMLGDGLVEFEAGMRRCLAAPDAIPDESYVAFLSLSYNIGNGAFCRSSVARYANRGDLRSACGRILAFNKAGGKVIKGLVRRREAERDLCMKGLG